MRVMEQEPAQPVLTLRVSIGRPSLATEVVLLTDSLSVVCQALELLSPPIALLGNPS